jgi:hypothetical protein
MTHKIKMENEMENYLENELEVLEENIDLIAEKMTTKSLSVPAIKMAGELLTTLLLIKDKIVTKKDISKERLLIVVKNLPLLYLQIPKIA